MLFDSKTSTGLTCVGVLLRGYVAIIIPFGFLASFSETIIISGQKIDRGMGLAKAD